MVLRSLESPYSRITSASGISITGPSNPLGSFSSVKRLARVLVTMISNLFVPAWTNGPMSSEYGRQRRMSALFPFGLPSNYCDTVGNVV